MKFKVNKSKIQQTKKKVDKWKNAQQWTVKDKKGNKIKPGHG